MQKTKVTDKKISNAELSGIDRIYIGNDYCENNIDFSNITKLIDFYSGKIEISLLFPFLTDKSFYKIAEVLKKIERVRSDNAEVIFNDWGLFYFLRTYYPKLKLVMGRLLTKQKKDPRADIILNNKQEKIKILKSDSGNQIVCAKKTPKSLFDIFSRHSIESDEVFNFLLENNVSRIEIDNLTWHMNSSITKKIKVSLYFPYILLAVTRYCGAMNGQYSKICNFSCKNKPVSLGEGFYMNGNSLYYKNDILPNNKILKSNNIDRIVYRNKL